MNNDFGPILAPDTKEPAYSNLTPSKEVRSFMQIAFHFPSHSVKFTNSFLESKAKAKKITSHKQKATQKAEKKTH